MIQGLQVGARRSIDALARSLAAASTRRPLPALTEHSKALIRQLREDVVRVAKPSTSEYGADPYWLDVVERIYELILTDDPRRFLTWAPVRETMFTTGADYLNVELNALRKDTQWETVWRPKLPDPFVGRPVPHASWPRTTGNTIHHLYHLWQFQQATGVNLFSEDLDVLEFGAGYGNMCRILTSEGSRRTYSIIDLPIVSHLQRYYLDSVRLQVGVRGDGLSVKWLNLEDNIEATGSKHSSVFVGAWSLSESDVLHRPALLASARQCSAQLIGFQDTFGAIDNTSAMGTWVEQQPEFEWSIVPIAHLPGNSYLFGVRK